jgi:hypothetical protein
MPSPYRSASRWAAVVRWSFIAIACVICVALVDAGLFVAITWRRANGLSTPDWIVSVFRIALLCRTLALPLLLLTTYVVLPVWCFRAHRNLPSLGIERPKFGPWTAALCYFIPIANFFWPVLTMRQLWHGSDPSSFATPSGYYGRLQQQKPKTPAVIWCWWASFLVFNLLLNAEPARIAAMERPFYAPSWYAAGTLLALAWMVGLGSAVLMTKIVRRIDEFQRQRRAAMLSLCMAQSRRAPS